MPDYSIAALRQQCVAQSTRPFVARGASMTRCPACQLGVHWCICPYRAMAMQHAAYGPIDFCLILHRNETMKPTNTGRLIGELLPHGTHAYLWHRTEPDPLLLAFLAARAGNIYMVFPTSYCTAEDPAGNPVDRRSIVNIDTIDTTKRPTFVLLDGTWKQARKMFHMSEWIKQIPVVRFDMNTGSRYRLRQGSSDKQVSTLEAAATVLELTGGADCAAVMRDYFAVFNEHYAASRDSRVPLQLTAMERLAQPLHANTTPPRKRVAD